MKNIIENKIASKINFVNQKLELIQQLEYEIGLIKKDCFEIFQAGSKIPELCDLFNLHTVWLEQPKSNFNKRYGSLWNLQNEYQNFMYKIQNSVLSDVIDTVEFEGPIMCTGISVSSLRLPFKYCGQRYYLEIPNRQGMVSYEDMLYFGNYSILLREGETSCTTIYSCATYKEIQENIEKVLQKHILGE